MRNFRVFLVIAGIFCVCATYSFAQTSDQQTAFKPGSEPDGFRGIKWGTTLSSLSGMEPFYGNDDIKVYLKKGDALKWGSAKLERIQYHFWKGRLMLVLILTPDYDNYKALDKALIEQFGPGDRSKDEIAYWVGNQTTVEFAFQKKESYDKEIGGMQIYSTKIVKQWKVELMEKIQKAEEQRKQKQ